MGDANHGTDGTCWVSTAELAEVRGISKRSASRLTRRYRWRRQKGDDGIVRVAVPAAELEFKPDEKTEAGVQELTVELQAMRTRMTDLRLAEAMARTRAEALQAEVERLNALLGAGLLGRLLRFWRRPSKLGAGEEVPT